MPQRSKHQERIIKNYYNNQDSILLQRLSDLVSDLYLSEGKARARIWQRATAAMEKLKIPASRIEHLIAKDDPALLAKLIEELLASGDR